MSRMNLTKLLWLDLEMTGLKPETDLILEVACLVTDLDFNELACFEAVIKPTGNINELMDEYVTKMHTSNGLIERLKNGDDEAAVIIELKDFIENNFADQDVVLAGNSIHMDRRFLEFHWPSVAKLLHYRMLDVSSFKILAQSKYELDYEKGEAHRALADIRESILELQFYENNMGLKK